MKKGLRSEVALPHASRSWSPLIAAIASQIQQTTALSDLWQTTVIGIGQVLECDRVMVINPHNEVIAEAVSAPKWSLLAQVLPADREPEPAAQELVVPLVSVAQAWGSLTIQNFSAQELWHPDDQTALGHIAILLGIAIYQAELEQRLHDLHPKQPVQSQPQHSDHCAECSVVNTKLQQIFDQRFQLAAIVESSQDAIISKSPTGIITTWNHAAETLFGYSSQEAIGQPITMLFPPERYAEEDLILAHIQRGEQVKTFQSQRQHKDGTLIDVDLTISPIFDEQGVVIGASTIIRDLRDRNQVAQELQEKTKELNQFFSVSLDLLCIANLDGTLYRLNQQWEKTLGYPLAGLEQSNFWDYVHPDDLESTQEQVQRLSLQQEVNEFTNRYRRQDGSYVWLEWRSFAVGDMLYAAARDISVRRQAGVELKKAKEQLELVLTASSEGFSDWDMTTNIIYFSPRWKAMLGYADHELENSLSMWESTLFEEDQVTAWRLIEDYNSGKSDAFVMTQRHYHKNGSTVYLLTRVLHLKDADGHVIRMVGSHLDITSMVELQQALQTSEMQLSSILNSSLDGIMAFGAVRNDRHDIIDFEWLLSNPIACEMVGRDALNGKRLLVELPGHREQGLFDAYVQVVKSGEPCQREFYYPHDGIESWFQNTAVKLGDGFSVTLRDVTAMKTAEQALQLANQQLEDRVADLNERHAEMMILSEISDFLQASLTVTEACQALSGLVEALFPSCSGALYLTSSSRDRVALMSSWGDTPVVTTDFQPQTCWALRRGRLHYCDHSHSKLRCQHSDAGTTLCVPMIAQGETLGLFYLTTAAVDALPDSKRQLARTVAEQVGLAIANLNLRETLQNQSIRDPLTGLFNRRYLEEALGQELNRSKRKDQTTSIVMLDVDHFKRFNDNFGHDAGDYVLQCVGKVLKDNVRGSDIACRYGGEEMILILADISLEQATLRADMVREAIANMRLSYNGHTLGTLTVSLGVAAYPTHGATGTKVVQAADAALYRAKAAGRNCVVVAT